MKTLRPGGTTLASPDDANAGSGTPGKQTLVQMLEAAPAAQPVSPRAPASDGTELLQGAAKLEGPVLFSGPDAGISADAPSIADPAKASDEDYEKTVGIKSAIDKKAMLPVAGINGQSFTAIGCAGKKDGKVTFTFDRAFVGDYDYPAAGKAVRGVHVSISAALSGCGEHKEVKMVQVYRFITKKDGKIANAVPTTAKRKDRAGWNDDKAKSKGWMVDGLDTDTSPFYVSSDIYGDDGTDKAAARLRDSPGSWATDKNIGKEFRTCAVSYAGGKGTVLACIDWGYYIDDKGAASFYPAKPTAYAGPVQELTDAAERWDGLAGNTKANLVK